MCDLPTVITVDGNIGSGKSTLITHLKSWAASHGHSNICFATEPLQVFDLPSGNLLRAFYAAPEKLAFAMQVCCFSWRTQFLRALRAEHPGAHTIIVERSALSDVIFARANLRQGAITPMEFDVYMGFVGALTSADWSPKIDRALYLRCPPEVCQPRIAERNRDLEAERISIEYLKVLHEEHERWAADMKRDKINVTTIDSSKSDWSAPDDLAPVLAALGL